MYITDIDEVVSLLRSKLPQYLSLSLGEDNFSPNRKFKCFAHNDNTPSMCLNPKTDNETVKCFACGYHGDIFTVAEHFDNLPTNGPEWLTITIPTLCEKLDINYSPGTLSVVDKERISLYKLAQDISDILASQKSKENLKKVVFFWIPMLWGSGN